MYPKSNLKLGDHRANCEICDFSFHASELRKNWRNLYVCKKDFEPREELDFLKGIPDDPSVPWTRPDTSSLEDNCASPWNIAGFAISGCAIAGFYLTFTKTL